MILACSIRLEQLTEFKKNNTIKIRKIHKFLKLITGKFATGNKKLAPKITA